MNASRSAGYSGSSGRYAPPALSTPSRPATSSTERSAQTPTRVSGPTPAARSRCATRLACAFSSAYVRLCPSMVTATASGVAAARSSIGPCSVCSRGKSAVVSFQAASRSRSAAGSSGSRDTGVSGAATTASSSAVHRWAIRSTLTRSNRSVLKTSLPQSPSTVSTACSSKSNRVACNSIGVQENVTSSVRDTPVNRPIS